VIVQMARWIRVVPLVGGATAGLLGILTACGVIVGAGSDGDAPVALTEAGGPEGAALAPCLNAPGQPETCNGIDDDCDGTVDERCPSGIVIGAANARSPTYGESDGGGPYDDTCPPGEVLIGLSTVTSSWLMQIGGICGHLSIRETTDTDPRSYGVDVSRGTTMPNRGRTSGQSGAVVCPDGGVVVGVAGKAGLYIDQLSLRCGSLEVTGGPGNFGLAIATAGGAAPIGGDGGKSFAAFSCPDGGAVARMLGRSGSYVDRIIFACATPALQVRP
jgi:hypothetical protein